MKRGEKKAPHRDTRQQPDENGEDPLPYRWNALAIDEQNVQVDENLDHHQGGIQDAVRVENECNRNGERGKSIAERAIDEGRQQGDRGKNEHCGIEGKHPSSPISGEPSYGVPRIDVVPSSRK